MRSGRKMSKTLGNGVDPLDVIEKYSTDALRFSVISGTTMGNDIRYLPEKLDQASNFANKIWNAAKFITTNLVEDEKIISFKQKNYNEENNTYKENALKIEDEWIIAKLENLVKEVTKNLETYELGVALDKIYNFLWNEFCDWYIEMAKTRLYSENENEKIQVCYVLDYVFRTSLKLLHPFMPFVTSQIYSKLVQYDDTELMVCDWPKIYNNNNFKKSEEFIELIKEIIVEIRNIRANMNVHPSKKAKLIFVTKEYETQIEQAKEFITKLGFGNEIKIQNNKEGIPQNAISILSNGIEVFMPFEELVDIEEEKERLQKEKTKLESEVARSTKMLSNEGFISKAPQAKIDEEKAKLEKYKEMLEGTIERLKNLK